MKPKKNTQCEAGIPVCPRGKMPRLCISRALPLMLFLSIPAWAANVNGTGASLNLPTTDLPSGGAQTNGTGARLLSAGTPDSGVVSVNAGDARLIIEPLYTAPGGAGGGAPVADFTADASSGAAPLEVQFTDLSSGGWYGIVSWSWDFGDGSPYSDERNPQHTYDAPGTYRVTLTILTPGGAASVARDGYVSVVQGVPVADACMLLLLAAVLAAAGGILTARTKNLAR